MPSPSNDRLVADTTRQASASLAGYVFQVWHSLLEWLLLEDDEALELEGNEDIDRLRGADATTIQVKHLDPARSLTLRSPDVVEATGNFWAARGRNPRIRLRFRFLSTAEAGFEAGDPFDGFKGLDLWRSARRKSDRVGDLERAANISKFLLESGKVPHPLKEWLSNAKPEAVLSDLIEPLEWDLGSGGMDSVRDTVGDCLVLLGEKFGLLPSDSRQAASSLLEMVAVKASSRTERMLTRVGLLTRFEELATISVSKSSFRSASAMQSLSSGAGLQAAIAPDGPHSVFLSSAQDGLPDLPSISLPRTKVVRWVAAGAAEGFVYLHGSNGMGKSTVAVMVARRTQPEPLWLDLRSAGHRAASLVRDAAAHLVRPGASRSLVLDDLSFTGDSRPLQDAVARAVSALSAVGGYVIATGAAALPPTLRVRLDLTDKALCAVPPLAESEINDLLEMYGLEEEAPRHAWAALISAQTGGHPLLVDARVQGLRNRGFPQLTADDYLTAPAELTEVREQARRLVNELPESQRSLLYRLSLGGMPFKREAALRIGGLPPPVSAPGDAFDPLVGPWVERVSGHRFRLSPLVSNAGRDAHGDEWALETHSRMADALFLKSLDQYDVHSICFHAVMGRNGPALTLISHAIVEHADDMAPAADMLGWFVHINPDDDAHTFGLSGSACMIVRLAQFEIAAHQGGAVALQALERLDLQTRLRIDSSRLDTLSRVAALSKMLLRKNVPIGPGWIVDAVVELSDIQSANSEIDIFAQGLEGSFRSDPDAGFDLGSLLALFLPGHLNTAGDLVELWGALEAQDPAHRSILLGPYRTEPGTAHFLPNEVWLAQMRSDQPDWEALVLALQDGYRKTLEWGAKPLASALAATVVRTLNENLKRHREAFRCGCDAVRTLGRHPMLADALADVCDWTRRPAAAKRLRRWALEGWGPSKTDPLGPSIVARKAAISAARNGDWQDATNFLLQAAQILPEPPRHVVFKAGLYADAGHAAARAGNQHQAVQALCSSLELLKKIDNVAGQTRAFRLHKLFGNLVAWLAGGEQVDASGIGIREQPPAACSNFEVAVEIANLQATPLEVASLLLSRYALPFLSDFPILLDDVRSAVGSSWTSVRALATGIQVSDAMVRGDMANILPLAVRHAREAIHVINCGNADNPLGVETPTPTTTMVQNGIVVFVQVPVLSCLVRHLERSASVLVPDTWMQCDEIEALAPDVIQNLKLLGTLSSNRLNEAWTGLKRANTERSDYLRLSYALALSAQADAAPDQLVHAHIIIFQALRTKFLDGSVASSASNIVTRQWRAISRQPFRLRTPRLTVPELEAALEMQPEGLAKTAAVLKAALPTTATNAPDWLIRELVEAIEG